MNPELYKSKALEKCTLCSNTLSYVEGNLSLYKCRICKVFYYVNDLVKSRCENRRAYPYTCGKLSIVDRQAIFPDSEYYPISIAHIRRNIR